MQLTPPPSPQLKGISTVAATRVGQVLSNGVQLLNLLGRGAYGDVYKAVQCSTGLPCAVKALNKLGLSARQQKFLAREIELHRRASAHPNVVSLLDVLDSPDCTYVVLEYCEEGDLFGNITEHGQSIGNDRLAKRIFLQILDAVEFCHASGIYHRDLKPENILLTDGSMTAKLADFGLACTDVYSSDFGCGSTFYMSPECLQDTPLPYAYYASGPNDVWSLGVILVNLVTGRNPWKKAAVDDATFAAFLQDSEFLKSILPLTDELDWILRRIFECDPAQRVNIQQLRQMILQCPGFTKASCANASDYDATDRLDVPSLSPCSDDREGFCISPTYSTYSDSSISDQDYPSTHHSPYVLFTQPHSDSPLGSFYELPPPQQQLPPKGHEVSSVATSWYSALMPALDFTQRHIFSQPLMTAIPVRLF